MTKFIGRKDELEWLESAYVAAKKEGQLLVLYGKRRVGKTELVTKFMRGKPGIYYLANRTNKAEQLESATRCFMSGLGDTHIHGSAFQTWRDFFDYLISKIGERPANGVPLVVVFDEFPYLAEADEGISSYFQYGWDGGLAKQKILLILMGSSISMMYREALEKRAPLYGRRTGQWLLEPFGYREAKEFYPSASFETSFGLYAVTGGIPAYAKLLSGDKSLKENIITEILPEGKYLSSEPELLIAEEFDDPKSYLTILQAIGQGRTKYGEILTECHVTSSALPIYLKHLIGLRLVKREIPVTEWERRSSKRGSYSLADPFLRFYFSFVFPNNSLIKSKAYKTLFAKKGEVLKQLVAKAYENETTEWIRRAVETGVLPPMPIMGRWWNRNTEIDLVGLDEESNSILLVETKWNIKPVGVAVWQKLRNKAKQVEWGREGRNEYFAIVAKGGFEEKLIELAKDEGVVLIEQDGRIVGR